MFSIKTEHQAQPAALVSTVLAIPRTQSDPPWALKLSLTCTVISPPLVNSYIIVAGVSHRPRLLQRNRWADKKGNERQRFSGSAQSERRGGRRWEIRMTLSDSSAGTRQRTVVPCSSSCQKPCSSNVPLSSLVLKHLPRYWVFLLNWGFQQKWQTQNTASRTALHCCLCLSSSTGKIRQWWIRR